MSFSNAALIQRQVMPKAVCPLWFRCWDFLSNEPLPCSWSEPPWERDPLRCYSAYCCWMISPLAKSELRSWLDLRWSWLSPPRLVWTSGGWLRSIRIDWLNASTSEGSLSSDGPKSRTGGWSPEMNTFWSGRFRGSTTFAIVPVYRN